MTVTRFPVNGQYRGVPKLAELAFATKQTSGFDLFSFEDGLFDVSQINEMNSNEKSGRTDATESNLLRYEASGSHSQKLLPAHMRFIALCFGNCTNATITSSYAYSHESAPNNLDMTLPSFTLNQHDGKGLFDFPGCVVSGFSIEGSANGFVKFMANLLGSGEKVSSSLTKPSRLSESYLKFGDVVWKTGVTIGSSKAISGGTAESAELTSFKFSVDNGAQMIYPAGSQTGYAKEAVRGNYKYSLSASFMQKAVEWETFRDANSYITLQFTIRGTAIPSSSPSTNYGFDILFPRVKVTDVKHNESNNLKTNDVTFEILNPDGTYDTQTAVEAVYIKSYDAVATYLA